jgi:hypothetical protein
MTHVECKNKVIPGAIETISKSFRKYLSNISGKQEIEKSTENNHIGHCTHTLESNTVKV